MLVETTRLQLTSGMKFLTGWEVSLPLTTPSATVRGNYILGMLSVSPRDDLQCRSSLRTVECHWNSQLPGCGSYPKLF
ncbi:hypothetical protein TNCV_4597511 [Trichonephila clavipes]|nr:hypothetical protein TNCV_4597511 [Trichonephila clavipes]